MMGLRERVGKTQIEMWKRRQSGNAYISIWTGFWGTTRYQASYLFDTATGRKAIMILFTLIPSDRRKGTAFDRPFRGKNIKAVFIIHTSILCIPAFDHSDFNR